MENVFDSIVIHYDEIGLKGNNRTHFENKLIDNIKIKMKDLAKSCIRESGQITVAIEKADPKIKDILEKIPGIAHFSFAKRCSLDIEEIKKHAIALLKDKKFDNFRVSTKRHDKNVKFKSPEVDTKVGKEIVDIYKKEVRLKNSDIDLKIDLTSRFSYISMEDIKCVGGLPTNRKQKVAALLSGGFDSPVASYLMMKRGCEVILVHFQNQNQMTGAVKDKILKLTKQLSKFQLNTKLYIIPFEKLQKEIIMKVHSTLRMLVYRRFMIKIASGIAKKEKARFLVVGDSLSQVASQTLDNLESTYADSEKGILSPLIGLDKKEIIAISRIIGTHDISALPYGDCCSYFLPKHPELKSTAGKLDSIEKEFDIGLLVEESIKNADIKEF